MRGFRNTADYDRADNIVGMCPNHHTEYDNGNITIDFDKQMCIHRDPKDPFHHKKLVGSIRHIKPGYFDYHRVHIFRPKL